MTFVAISDDAILRADPHYFNSYTAFNKRTFKSVHLNQQQYAILEMVGKFSYTLEEVNNCFQVIHGQNNNISLNILFKEGILKITEEQPKQRQIKPVNYEKPFCTDVPITSSPTQIELCITRRCNQACFHCNISAYSQSKPEKLDIEFWKRFIDQCVEENVLKITVTGGEPFIREGWDEFYEHLVNAPIGVSILTNGTRIRDDHMEKMRYAGHTLSISLDGVNAKQHEDFRRSPGSFDQTITTMRRLHEHGVIFTINTVIHSENFNEVEKIFDIGKEVGANCIVVVPIASVGRGASKASQKYFPKNRDITEALEKARLRAFHEGGPDMMLANVEEHEMLEIHQTFSGATQMSRRHPGFCKAGIYAMAVDEDGVAYSCLRGLQTRIHPIGDLKFQSLPEIWSRKQWGPFRDPSLPRVPCRVEHIGNNRGSY
jgi:MoaA/NifB/PqqE/SkfB family radical SAM enzyme